MSDTPSPLRPLHVLGTLAAWSSIGLWQLWFSLGDDLPVYLQPHLVDLGAFAVVGLALALLRTWPWLGNPLWALATPALLAVWGLTPRSLTGSGVYLLGLLVAIWGVSKLARLGRLPAIVAVLAMPASLLCVDLLIEDTPRPRQRLLPPRVLSAEAAPPPIEGRPVILLTVDTLRWDRANTMSSVQRLRAKGAWWEKAMSSSTWTLPALSSIHTGTMPQTHGATCLEDMECQGLSADVTPLAERLRAQGYDTVAVASNPWTNVWSGLTRGFRMYRDLSGLGPRRLLLSGYPMPTHDHMGAEVVVDATLRDLDQLDGGAFFLWVHFIDPHMPYKHAEPGTALFDKNTWRELLASPDSLGKMNEAYDDEVAVVDAHLNRLIDELEARGVFDEAIVVFAGDHGEEFLDHGDYEHGHSHHTEVVDVPIVVIGPGIRPGERSDLASLVDIAPTILGLLGQSTDGTEGYDLRKDVPVDRIAVAHGNLIARFDCSARDRDRRVIIEGCNLETPYAIKAYDTYADPDEHVILPIDPSDPLFQAASSTDVPKAAENALPPSAALRALGYLD